MEMGILVLQGLTLIGFLVIVVFIAKLSKQIDSKSDDNSLIREEFSKNREEINNNFSRIRTENLNQLSNFSSEQSQKFSEFETKQNQISKTISDNLNRIYDISDKKMSEVLNQNNTNSQNMNNAIKTFTKDTEVKLNEIKTNVDSNLKEMQKQNSAQLEKMRQTVDEKLHKTLETRLSESFKRVSENLVNVQKGLNEMQALANGVGDLKKVLSNIKTKGVLGEYQLENILAEILTPAQYEKNINTIPDSRDRVEFAIKMPGQDHDEHSVYLPIDAKFPTEDYQSLLSAYDEGEQSKITECKKSLEQKIKIFAKTISSKYVFPPYTTDFAIMFLPFEGLYAEVLRINALFEYLQREERIIITGPTTIAAFLNSLQMGFRTLAIQKRTSDVWNLLGIVKTEFGKFSKVLEKTKKKLNEANNVIEKAQTRTRVMGRKLKTVEALPDNDEVMDVREEETEET